MYFFYLNIFNKYEKCYANQHGKYVFGQRITYRLCDENKFMVRYVISEYSTNTKRFLKVYGTFFINKTITDYIFSYKYTL